MNNESTTLCENRHCGDNTRCFECDGCRAFMEELAAQAEREAVLDLDAAAKRFQYEHRNACYPDATEFEAREAAEQIVLAALTTPAPAERPKIGHASGCVKINCGGCGTDFYSADYSRTAPTAAQSEREAVLEQLRAEFQMWLDRGPDEQPHYPSGMRPFSTGDLKAFVAALKTTPAPEVSRDEGLLDAFARTQWMLESIARTNATNFVEVHERIIANRAILSRLEDERK